MDLDRREEIGRVGADVGRHQRRRQHLVAGHEVLHRQHRRDAEHQDDRDLVLEEQLLGADRRLDGVELVVIGDDLDLVLLAAHLDAAGSVDLLRPDLDSVEAGKAPARGIAGERREEADLDGLLFGEDPGRCRAEGGQARGNATRCCHKLASCDVRFHRSRPPVFTDICEDMRRCGSLVQQRKFPTAFARANSFRNVDRDQFTVTDGSSRPQIMRSRRKGCGRRGFSDSNSRARRCASKIASPVSRGA